MQINIEASVARPVPRMPRNGQPSTFNCITSPYLKANLITNMFAGPFEYSFVKSSRGTRLISVNAFRFSERKKKNDTECPKKRWRCSTHSCMGCTAKVHTIYDKVVFICNKHNHSPPSSKIDYGIYK